MSEGWVVAVTTLLVFVSLTAYIFGYLKGYEKGYKSGGYKVLNAWKDWEYNIDSPVDNHITKKGEDL